MRVAVFVDAGYVYSQGAILVSKSEAKKSRDKTHINPREIVAKLVKFTAAISNKGELLRIYWYDAEPSTGRSEEQKKFASHDNVKLRLGQLNSAGQQKGVDSLIVIDITELARNRAITDAVVFTGDEDIRIAVEIAQNHGVRVHLLGIDGISPKGSQSLTLQNEADTVSIWKKADVETFMTVDIDPVVVLPKPRVSKLPTKPMMDAKVPTIEALLVVAANEEYTLLKSNPSKLAKVHNIIAADKAIPGDVVKLLYARIKTLIKRDAVKSEKDNARDLLKREILRKR